MTPPYFRNYVCTHASIHACTIPHISIHLHTLIENTFRKGLLFAKESIKKESCKDSFLQCQFPYTL